MHTNKLSFSYAMFLTVFFAFMTLFWSFKNVSQAAPASPATATGTPLPKLDIPTLQSKKHLTNKAFIGHVSVLNVWASWCSYCRREHATLMNIKKTSPVPIYGINYKDNSYNASAYLKNEGNPYTLVGADSDGSASSDLDVDGTPTTLLIDKHGKIRYRHVGTIDQYDWDNELLPLIKQYENE